MHIFTEEEHLVADFFQRIPCCREIRLNRTLKYTLYEYELGNCRTRFTRASYRDFFLLAYEKDTFNQINKKLISLSNIK